MLCWKLFLLTQKPRGKRNRSSKQIARRDQRVSWNQYSGINHGGQTGHTCEGRPLLGSSASCPRPVPSSLWWKCVVPSFKTCPETPDLLLLFSSFLGFVHPCTAPHTESSGHLPAFSQPPAPFPTSLHCMSLPPRLEE